MLPYIFAAAIHLTTRSLAFLSWLSAEIIFLLNNGRSDFVCTNSIQGFTQQRISQQLWFLNGTRMLYYGPGISSSRCNKIRVCMLPKDKVVRMRFAPDRFQNINHMILPLLGEEIILYVLISYWDLWGIHASYFAQLLVPSIPLCCRKSPQ